VSVENEETDVEVVVVSKAETTAEILLVVLYLLDYGFKLI